MEEKNNDLQEFLAAMSDDDHICVGSASSYFFCGTVSDFKKCHKAIDRKLEEYWKNRVASAREAVLGTCSGIAKDIREGTLRHNNIDANCFDMSRIYKTYFANLDNLNNLLPVYQRKVKESYPRFDEPCTAVIVEGKEAGEYWYEEEFYDLYGLEKLKKYMEDDENDADT